MGSMIRFLFQNILLELWRMSGVSHTMKLTCIKDRNHHLRRRFDSQLRTCTSWGTCGLEIWLPSNGGMICGSRRASQHTCPSWQCLRFLSSSTILLFGQPSNNTSSGASAPINSPRHIQFAAKLPTLEKLMPFSMEFLMEKEPLG